MAQLVICGTPNHPHSKFGDVEGIYDDNVELSGSGYDDKKIVKIPQTVEEFC